MLLPVTVNGERLLALLDTGSTHNFLPASTMHRLALQPTGGEQLRVTVANGDRLRCHGIAQQFPILIGDESFAITCVGIDLGDCDFILGVYFLRTLGPILFYRRRKKMAQARLQEPKFRRLGRNWRRRTKVELSALGGDRGRRGKEFGAKTNRDGCPRSGSAVMASRHASRPSPPRVNTTPALSPL
ncbi:Pentatricopeptide repeat-containing protein [Hordeum vulgare]|nr:Pentatricopeptide repeat-containing protein [Hordeum vulgare]